MDSNKMTTCKACGSEIAKSAKACPHCGAKNKKKHPILGAVLVFLGLVIIIGAFGGNSTPKPASESGTQTQTSVKETEKPTTPPKTTFGIGEKAELKDVCVTMLAVEESKGSQFNQPTDGNVFILCEFEIENNSKSEIAVSSMASFTAYCDDYSLNYSLGSIMEKGNKNQLDGQVAPGKKMNGVVGYEVPADWKELEIRFTPNFFTSREIIFIANH